MEYELKMGHYPQRQTRRKEPASTFIEISTNGKVPAKWGMNPKLARSRYSRAARSDIILHRKNPVVGFYTHLVLAGFDLAWRKREKGRGGREADGRGEERQLSLAVLCTDAQCRPRSSALQMR